MMDCSMISTTSDSMTSGAVPSQDTFTEMTGNSTLGSWLMPMERKLIQPKSMIPSIIIQPMTGRRMEISEMDIFEVSRLHLEIPIETLQVRHGVDIIPADAVQVRQCLQNVKTTDHA